MKSQVGFAQEAVTDLGEVVEQLAGCIEQGTDRPWRPPALTLERRNELDRLARLERLERDEDAPGETAAPLDLDVMTQLVEILAAAETLTAAVCAAAGLEVPAPSRSAFTDPRPHLRLLHNVLPLIADATPQLLREVEDEVRQLIERAHQVLGLISDGQVLKAVCPWCGGRTEAHPTGGAHTLRVRNIHGLDTTVVVCEGGACEPPAEDCGTWVRGRPAWRQYEWDWLADRINRTSNQEAS